MRVPTRTTAVLLALSLAAGFTGACFAAPLVSIDSAGFHSVRDVGGMSAYIRTEPLISSETRAAGLAEQLFSMSGMDVSVTLTENSEGKYGFVDSADRSASFYYTLSTGDISFNRGTADYSGDGDTPGLPDNEEAVRLALEHLEALELLPGNPDELVVDRTGSLNMAVVREDGSESRYRKQVWVHFKRVIDGIEVRGPGSKIIVYLGENGELTKLIRRWTEVDTYELNESAFISDDRVLGKMRERLCREWREADEIETGAPEFVIYDDGHGILEPAYAVDARVFHVIGGKHLIEDLSLVVIPAVKFSSAWYDQQDKAESLPVAFEL